jgi:hypothetical protein
MKMDALPNHRRSWKEKRLRKPGRNMIMISSRLGDCKFGGLECEGFADQDSIVCGLYINITLHDYLRTIVNLNSTNSTWTLVGQKLPLPCAIVEKDRPECALVCYSFLNPFRLASKRHFQTNLARIRVSKRTTFPPKPGHLEVLEIRFRRSSTWLIGGIHASANLTRSGQRISIMNYSVKKLRMYQ